MKQKIKTISQVLRTTITRPFMHNPKVLNSEQTVDLILKNNLSIGRFGDGELDIIYKKEYKQYKKYLNFKKNH